MIYVVIKMGKHPPLCTSPLLYFDSTIQNKHYPVQAPTSPQLLTSLCFILQILDSYRIHIYSSTSSIYNWYKVITASSCYFNNLFLKYNCSQTTMSTNIILVDMLNKYLPGIVFYSFFF